MSADRDMRVEALLHRLRIARAVAPEGLGVPCAIDDAVEAIESVIGELVAMTHRAGGYELHELVDMAIDVERAKRDAIVRAGAEAAAIAARAAVMASARRVMLPEAPIDRVDV